MTTDKMESERGDTGGRTRTVFVETGLETATFAEALARRDAMRFSSNRWERGSNIDDWRFLRAHGCVAAHLVG